MEINPFALSHCQSSGTSLALIHLKRTWILHPITKEIGIDNPKWNTYNDGLISVNINILKTGMNPYPYSVHFTSLLHKKNHISIRESLLDNPGSNIKRVEWNGICLYPSVLFHRQLLVADYIYLELIVSGKARIRTQYYVPLIDILLKSVLTLINHRRRLLTSTCVLFRG